MANVEHLEILKKGVEALNEWRRSNPTEVPDLVNADLEGAELRDAKLGGADLQGANLGGAKLRDARLQRACPFGKRAQGRIS